MPVTGGAACSLGYAVRCCVRCSGCRNHRPCSFGRVLAPTAYHYHMPLATPLGLSQPTASGRSIAGPAPRYGNELRGFPLLKRPSRRWTGKSRVSYLLLLQTLRIRKPYFKRPGLNWPPGQRPNLCQQGARLYIGSSHRPQTRIDSDLS